MTKVIFTSGKCGNKYTQYMTELFWKRLISEYLLVMQERQKWTKPRRKLTPGDIVSCGCYGSKGILDDGESSGRQNRCKGPGVLCSRSNEDQHSGEAYNEAMLVAGSRSVTS